MIPSNDFQLWSFTRTIFKYIFIKNGKISPSTGHDVHPFNNIEAFKFELIGL